MSVILHGNHYSIVFLNSWDVSGAMGNVWNEDLIFTIPPSRSSPRNGNLGGPPSHVFAVSRPDDVTDGLTRAQTIAYSCYDV